MFISRLIRALLLDINLYEEVEHDKSSIWQSMVVVLLASLAAGLYTHNLGGIKGLIVGTVLAFAGWIVMSFLIYLVGTKLFPGTDTKTNIGEILRVLGFAGAPGIFLLVALLPVINNFAWVVILIIWVWRLVAMIIAIKQALDFKNTWSAIWVCVIGLIAYMLVYIILLFAYGLPKPIWT
ncbi:MAG: YIP1 family protein [Candidatus Dadabacteria bacterium]